MKVLFATIVITIVYTSEEFDANSKVRKEETKTKIVSLAEKYDVKVDPSRKAENVMSLEEREDLFRDIK